MQITVIDKRGREGSWDRKQPTPIHHSLKSEKKFKNLKMGSRIPPFSKQDQRSTAVPGFQLYHSVNQ